MQVAQAVQQITEVNTFEKLRCFSSTSNVLENAYHGKSHLGANQPNYVIMFCFSMLLY